MRKKSTNKAKVKTKLTIMVAILSLATVFRLSLPSTGEAVVTVNWLDPLSYQKPQPIEVSLPNEATANKYYVDVNASPGGNGLSWGTAWQDLTDADGNITAPAYIYVKAGNYGTLWWYNANVNGSSGNEVVVQAYGDGVASLRATSSSNNTLDGSGVHHIIFDGGPDLELEFLTHNGSRYGLTIRSSNITVWRCRFRAGNYSGCLTDIGSFATVEDINFINCEFYDADNVSGTQQNMYWGAGNGSWIKSGSIKNCIFRDMGGEGIEFNPRNGNPGGYDLENMIVSGNVFHNVGKQTCSSGWKCRPAITIAGHDGGSCGDVLIKNNLIWDIGSSAIWSRSGGTSIEIYNNTIYNYDNYTNEEGRRDPEGITTWSDGGTATVRNNVVYDPGGTDPFDNSSFTKSNNLCGSGEGCDTTYNANTFLSVDENNENFLRLKSNSPAIDAGTNVGVTTDFFANSRPKYGGYDIGAHEYTVEAPQNLRIISID